MSYTAETVATFENDKFCGVTYVYYNPNTVVGLHHDYSHTWFAFPLGSCTFMLTQYYFEY
jgi:hypothetical protein